MTNYLDNPEQRSHPSQMFDMLVSDRTLLKHTQWIRQMLPSLSDDVIDQEEKELRLAERQASERDDQSAEASVALEIQALYHRVLVRRSFDNMLHNMEAHPGMIHINTASPLAVNVAEMIRGAGVPEIQNFVPFDNPRLKNAAKAPQSIMYSTIHGDEPLRIATRSFVGAQGFSEGWSGGRGDAYKKALDDSTEMRSSDVILQYAQLPAETAPPIDLASGYIQPDGKILYVSENAHRTAAAVMRGDEFVTVNALKLYKLNGMVV